MVRRVAVLLCLTSVLSAALRIGAPLKCSATVSSRTKIVSHPAQHGVRELLEGRVVPTVQRVTRAVPAAVTRVAQVRLPVGSPSPEDSQAGTQPTSTARVWLEDGDLRAEVGECSFELLRGVDGAFTAPCAAAASLMLSFEGMPLRSEHVVSLGHLGCERILAGARTKRWWMGPSFGTRAADVPPETQFLLLQLADDAYACLLPLVDGPSRATLRGRAHGGGGHASDQHALELLAHTGDRATKSTGMVSAVQVCVGDDPYALLADAFSAAADALCTFEVRPPAPAARAATCDGDDGKPEPQA